MSIIEQAAKRLEELRRGGVDVPWSAAGLSEERFDALLGKADAKSAAPAGGAAVDSTAEAAGLPAAAVHRLQSLQSLQEAGVRRPEPGGRAGKARRAESVSLDLDGLAREGYLVPSMVRSELAMAFRQIKRPLLRNAARKDDAAARNALIMITSALPGEGKTFCSINLAMSIAMEVDTSVLLVDADVVRPTIMERLALPPAPGFLDVLTDDRRDLGDVILRTNVPKLSILPAGTRNAMATELLASDAMDRLLTELATRYPDRVVILDAPPLLITSEARVLASRVGQVVVVVDSSSTAEAQVSKTFAALEHCPLVMSVLNKCAEPEHGRGYEYGYDWQ